MNLLPGQEAAPRARSFEDPAIRKGSEARGRGRFALPGSAAVAIMIDPGSGGPMMSDEMLAECTRQDGDAAFSALLARHCDGVYRIASNLCPSPRDAEEATRQTILSASREAGSRPRDKSFRVWLYGIALKQTLWRRKETPGPRPVSPEIFLPRFDARGSHEPPCREWPALAHLEPRSVSGLLRLMLSSMDDDLGAAFVLCDLVDLPAEDAAAILQTSPEVVRRRTHRVRLMVRGFLEQLCSA